MAALTRMAMVSAAALGAAAAAHGQQIAVSLSGFDVLNRFGAPMSSFHAQYTQLSPAAFLELDHGSFTSVAVMPSKGGVIVQWLEGTIEPGEWAHVGFSLTESPPQQQRVIDGGFEFDPGTPPLAAATAQKWESAGGGRWRDVATGECCFTQISRMVATTDLDLSLDDMIPTGALRLLATAIDPAPVEIPVDGLTYDYPPVSLNTWCIMIYDVIDPSTGEVTMRFCNAVRGRPCPADWDGNGVVNSTDVSNFINSWFEDQEAGTIVADWNGDGVSNSTDVSDFINSWFENLVDGCGGK